MSAAANAAVAAPKNGALPRERIERIIEDLRYEPAWRATAQREADIYDGNQLDSETLSRMEALGMPPIIVNLVAPTIDAVIGLEARTRTDPLLRPETDDSDSDAIEALNVKLKESLRLARFDRACSDAFASAAKVGIGWIEVSRNDEPFGYPYRLASISRKEMWWDWRAREPDLSDARFVVRRRWYDADDLVTHFPDHKDIVHHAVNVRPHWEYWSGDEAEPLLRALDVEHATSLYEEEWRDTERHRLALYEVWYKTFAEIEILRLPDGRVVEYDRRNDRHRTAVEAGFIRPEKSRTHRMRVAYYIGPHQVADEPTPYKHHRFPYVPVFGKREDRSGAPYGLIRAMRSPQEEVNARRTKMLHQLSSRRVLADRDAVDDHEQTAQDISRSDAYIILNEGRRNTNGLRVDSDGDLSAQQYQLLLESKGNVQEATGLFQEFLGRSQSGGQSGEAIKNLVEQGVQVLGEIMDNNSEARRQAAELLMQLIVEDLSGQPDVEVAVKRPATGQRKTVVLNEQTADEHGVPYRNNDVMRLRMHVALDETPSTASHRQQTLDRLLEITRSLPDDMQVGLVDFVIRASDLPDKDEMAQQLRQMSGLPSSESEPASEEEAMAQQQEQQAAADRERQLADLEMRERQAEVAKKEADAALNAAKAEKLASADTKLTNAEIMKILAGIEREDREQGASLTERGARLMSEQERQDREAMQPPQGSSGARNAPAGPA